MAFVTKAILLLGVIVAVAECGIPVNVMLPLDAVTNDGYVNNYNQLANDMRKMKQAGVAGIMGDVWWGIVEKSPKVYNFAPYLQIAELAKSIGLKWQPVFSFHRCGGNVGDNCNIPLPQFVLDVGKSNPDIFYKDQEKHSDEEYISLGVDNEALFGGRTGLQLYSDFMKAFRSNFSSYLGPVINEIQVGLGPCGELRYPSYQLDRWSYCGVGEFQCYDKYSLAMLQKAAKDAGHSEWGSAGPANAGGYNSRPYNAPFFQPNGNDNYASGYGRFFLNWYSSVLINHGNDILESARNIFGDSVELAAKVSGIHWWYKDNSHAAELTAGYQNVNGNDAYLQIARNWQKYNVTFDFTCLEMLDGDDGCSKGPEELVSQAKNAARSASINFSGENALDSCQPNCWSGAFDQIYKQATNNYKIHSFTYLRLTRNLLDNNNNWNMFINFVGRMNYA